MGPYAGTRIVGVRTGLIIRLHHCLADGIAGVGIMSVLLDADPNALRLSGKKIKLHVPPPRDPLTTLTAGFLLIPILTS